MLNFLNFRRSPDGKILIERSGSKSFLILNNVTAAFSGMYQCTASNELDVLYTAGRLKVVGM